MRMPDEIYLWIDYCCLPQAQGGEQFSDEDLEHLRAGLAVLPNLSPCSIAISASPCALMPMMRAVAVRPGWSAAVCLRRDVGNVDGRDHAEMKGLDGVDEVDAAGELGRARRIRSGWWR